MKGIFLIIPLSPQPLCRPMIGVLTPGPKVLVTIELNDAATLPILGDVDLV
jgi:hypothetical protein